MVASKFHACLCDPAARTRLRLVARLRPSARFSKCASEALSFAFAQFFRRPPVVGEPRLAFPKPREPSLDRAVGLRSPRRRPRHTLSSLCWRFFGTMR